MRRVGVRAFLYANPAAVQRRFRLFQSVRNDLSKITQASSGALGALDEFRSRNRNSLLVCARCLRQPNLAAADSCARTQMQMTTA